MGGRKSTLHRAAPGLLGVGRGALPGHRLPARLLTTSRPVPFFFAWGQTLRTVGVTDKAVTGMRGPSLAPPPPPHGAHCQKEA